MKTPEVSVVMSVYNGAQTLPTTLQSILTQEGCDFEFIVVNDGSTDESGQILDDWATRDNRLRVMHQANTGLTRALMLGCAEAQGEFIARQDCGDVSLPGRLLAQATILRAAPSLVMVACGVRFTGPRGENLYEVIRHGESLQEGLAWLDVNRIKGPPHHGGTMFRRNAYVAAGAYRAKFVVAQDIDLWLRLSEQGLCHGQSEVAYLASMEAGSISSRRRADQIRLATLAIDCTILRRLGQTDELLLDSAAIVPSPLMNKVSHRSLAYEKARFFYFVGSCLRQTDQVAAREYFRRAVGERPFFLRAWVRSFLG